MAIVCFIAAFVLMECIAWLMHKYIMHGWLWNLHQDHHQKREGGFLEKNDYFLLIFASPGIILFIWSAFNGNSYLFAAAMGITTYGICYFLVHDVYIHQRFKWFKRSNNFYFRAIKRAHSMHHKHLTAKDGECFGMLWVPLKYYKRAWKKR